MGNRLSKIYTRTGDDGSTGLGDGSRVSKTGARIEAMGAVDELNSVIGLLMTESLPDVLDTTLSNIQHTLFNLGGEIALPGHQLLREEQVHHIERVLDELNDPLPPLKEFILPGGSRAASFCHQARSVCRRAERRLIILAEKESFSAISLSYVNRLSDLFFVMARTINSHADIPDVSWEPSLNAD
ncbi:MAG: ATP:cob(I)alamin adenosyltransferase [Acidiferrobacteraceae bacterium]|nr:ATP:cob(I)alamin adenosyltransferase [Acidiferrobacteraceae bacterium]